MDMKIWQYDETTGIWQFVKNVTSESKEEWLTLLKKHAPRAHFEIANEKPTYKILGSVKKKGE